MPLKMKVESGDPTIVRVEHEGKKYVLRVGLQVFSVVPTGKQHPHTGLPDFQMTAAPVLHIDLDREAS